MNGHYARGGFLSGHYARGGFLSGLRLGGPEPVVLTTDEDDRQTGAGALLPEAPAPDPFTADEYDAIVHAIFDGLDKDPWRVGDLLADALGFLGRLALGDMPLPPYDGERAAGLLRRMEQRALWGPDTERPVRIIHAELP